MAITLIPAGACPKELHEVLVALVEELVEVDTKHISRLLRAAHLANTGVILIENSG